uniref:Magnesium chelatase n=1 Tax=Echinostoma caproni TaxID=27848 RepID=A0A183AV81_9TREM
LPILEDILQQIWNLATHEDPVTPIIIAQTRRRLAKLCHKPGRVSVVGVLSVAGADDLSKELMSMNVSINMLPKETVEVDYPGKISELTQLFRMNVTI